MSTTGRQRDSHHEGFEVFGCIGRSNTFEYAEQLRGLGVQDIACSLNSNDPLVLAKHEIKLLGAHGVEKSLIEESIVQIAAGGNHYVAVGLSGAVYSWGDGSRGQLGHNDTNKVESPKKIEALTNISIVQVACGDNFTVFLSNDGNVYTCGCNRHGVTGHGMSTGRQLVPRLVEALRGKHANQVSANSQHVAVATDQFDLYIWGRGDDGRLGHANEDNQTTPRLVEVLRGKAEQVACGSRHTAVIADDGLYTFGCNDSGQLGHGDKENRLVPTRVTSLDIDVKDVSCGQSHTASVVGCSLFTWGGAGGDSDTDDEPKKVDALKDYQVSHTRLLRFDTLAFVDPGSMRPSDSLPLVAAFAAMINNEEFSDVSFLVENQQIFALKGVLVQRCPFFNAMFESGLSESNNHHNIPISNIRKHIFLLVLEFLYTDSVCIESKDAIDLYTAADMYQLDRLKRFCLKSLEEDLSVANAASMLEKAAACGYEQPKTLCMTFVVKNFCEVSGSENFKQLRCPDLLQEVLAALSKEYHSVLDKRKDGREQ